VQDEVDQLLIVLFAYHFDERLRLQRFSESIRGKAVLSESKVELL
jgi:hypothetical protein